jgi:hypothetical protein
MQYLHDRLEENANSQPMTVYCVLCPKFEFEGTAAEARAASEAHREREHPELLTRRKIVRKKRMFSQAMTEEREAEIEEERRKRMRAFGIS